MAAVAELRSAAVWASVCDKQIQQRNYKQPGNSRYAGLRWMDPTWSIVKNSPPKASSKVTTPELDETASIDPS